MDDLSRELLISDAMRSEELQNAFMQRHAEALDEGLFKREGRDALDGAAEVEERLRKTRDDLLGQATNERQRSMLGEDLDAHLTVARDDIARHVARQTLQWERSVRQQRLDLLHAKARRDFADPARLAVYADAAAAAGENAEAARSALYRIAIGEALTRGQHKAARDLVDRAQPHLGEQDRADLEAELGIAGQLQRGNDYLATLLPNLLPATATDTDAAHEAAWQKNLIDWAHDPDQQATNRHLIDVRFGQHHRGLQKAQLALNDAVQAWMGETDSDGDPQTRRPPPAIWKQLDADQRREIDAALARNARGDAPPVGPPPGENVEGVQSGETMSDADPESLQDGEQIAQARPPGRGGVELTPAQQLRVQSYQRAIAEIGRRDPHNPMLSRVEPPNRIPTQREVEEAQREAVRLRQRPAGETIPEGAESSADWGTVGVSRTDAITRYNAAADELRRLDPEAQVKTYSLGSMQRPTEAEILELERAVAERRAGRAREDGEPGELRTPEPLADLMRHRGSENPDSEAHSDEHRRYQVLRRHKLEDSPTSRHLVENLDVSVREFIARYRKASVIHKFPGELLDGSVGEALESRNRTARKLLTRKEYEK